MGEPQALSRLPYTSQELVAVLKALRAAKRFTPVQLDILKQLGLLINAHVVPDLHKRVGESLYNSLMPEDIDTAFQMALNQARPIKGTVALQLRFDENAVEVAQYPWELLYRRRALLPSRAVELTRYISYPEAVTTLSVTPPLRLLYIQPRPTDLPTLPDESEQTTVRQALATLEAENMLRAKALPQSTYEALLDYLETETSHILHFDGHGVFARRCPVCQAMNHPRSTHCRAKKADTVCGQEIAGIESQGYLAFEHETRQTHWVRSETLGQLLFNRAIRLAVLSACRSSNVGGETLFGGTAPALIQAGVPAVVSTQLPISVGGAIKFARGFYRSLARFESLPAAVNAGRLRMPEQEWFVPTLYLRSKDDEGHLFNRPQGG
jgi:CHAT domain-containing protein